MSAGDPAGTVAALLAAGAATVGESGGLPMASAIAAAWRGAAVAGPAYTVRLGLGDNLAIHVACAEAPAGSVLVVAADPVELGYWGEVLTTQALARDIAGLVIDGGCRDVDALEARGFPVFSAAVALRGAVKDAGGAVQEPVVVGGVDVAPGDWVVGDADGVAVVPAAELEAVLGRSEARTRREQDYFAALEAGGTTIELLGLDTSSVRRGDR